MKALVVGGGLAGLVASHELVRQGHAVTVLEAGARWGGQIWTEYAQGFVVEHGAEGYAAARAAGAALCERLNVIDRLVSQQRRSSWVWCNGRLSALPTGEAARFAGIQTQAADLGHGIASLRRGCGELVDTLVAALAPRASLQLATPVVRLARRPGAWQINTHRGEEIFADAVVLAIPAAAAAELLEPVSAAASRMLTGFRTAPSVSVNLAFRRSAVEHPLDGSGFVSGANGDDEGFRACSFASSTFPGRAPAPSALLRAFFRPGKEYPLETPDAGWTSWALQVVAPVLGIRTQPDRSWVVRWPGALPRYAPDHAACVQQVADLLAGHGPVVLAGAPYRAAGIAGAIESAVDAVRFLSTIVV